MKYILDNDISPRHAEVLRIYDVDVTTVRHEFGSDAKDTEFIPELKKRELILISKDRGMQTGVPEAEALLQPSADSSASLSVGHPVLPPLLGN